MKDTSNRRDWSPPQFGIKHVLIITAAAAFVSFFVRRSGFDAAFPTMIVLCTLWLVLGIYRLVRSSNVKRDE